MGIPWKAYLDWTVAYAVRPLLCFYAVLTVFTGLVYLSGTLLAETAWWHALFGVAVLGYASGYLAISGVADLWKRWSP